MPTSTIALIEALDDLVDHLNRLPDGPDRRRRITTGLAHRLVDGTNTGLAVVVVDKHKIVNSLDDLLDKAVSLVRTGLADPDLEQDVIDTVVARVVEMAADLPGRDARRLAMWMQRVARWS